MGKKYGKHRTGLHHDDGLSSFECISGSQANRVRKGFKNIFQQDFNLSITYEANWKSATFIDVNLSLTIGKYQPYNKSKNNILYIKITILQI